MLKKMLTMTMVLALTTIVTLPVCDCYENHVESEECPCECHSEIIPANDRHWMEG